MKVEPDVTVGLVCTRTPLSPMRHRAPPPSASVHVNRSTPGERTSSSVPSPSPPCACARPSPRPETKRTRTSVLLFDRALRPDNWRAPSHPGRNTSDDGDAMLRLPPARRTRKYGSTPSPSPAGNPRGVDAVFNAWHIAHFAPTLSHASPSLLRSSHHPGRRDFRDLYAAPQPPRRRERASGRHRSEPSQTR